MKKGWDRYATEKRYVKKGYLRKYRNGNPSWKAPEASSSNSIQQVKAIQEEEEVIIVIEDVKPIDPIYESLALHEVTKKPRKKKSK